MRRRRPSNKAEYEPKPPEEIRSIARKFRRDLGTDKQYAPDLWILLRRIPELHPNFKYKSVRDTDLAFEAKAYCDAFILKIRESSDNALKYYGDTRTRFTVAHELGHLILGHPGNQPRAPMHSNGNRVDLILEREADIFASEFLMPSDLVQPTMSAEDISRLFQVSLDAAHRRFSELHPKVDLPIPKIPIQRSFTETPKSLEKRSPTIFVSMAYSDVMDRIYAEICKPTIESIGFVCVRADKIASVDAFSADIRRAIETAALVIAEITNFNPNVMHEIGLAQSIDKPTIILCRSGYRDDEIPSNIRHIRRIVYPNDAGGGPILRRHLEEILGLMAPSLKQR